MSKIYPSQELTEAFLFDLHKHLSKKYVKKITKISLDINLKDNFGENHRSRFSLESGYASEKKLSDSQSSSKKKINKNGK